MSRGRDRQGVRGPAVTGDRPGRRGRSPVPGHLPPARPGDAGRRRSSPRTTTSTSPSTTSPAYLAERGFGFLGWNTRFRGNEAHFLLDHALAEIGVGRPLAARAGRGRAGGAARQLGRRVADGRLPVAGRRAERRAGHRDAAAARHRGPAAGRPVRRAGRALRPARGADRLAGPVGHRRARPAVGRPGARPVQPGQRAALQRGLPAPLPRRPAGAQRADHRLGARRAGRAAPARGPGTGCSPCPAAGPTCG